MYNENLETILHSTAWASGRQTYVSLLRLHHNTAWFPTPLPGGRGPSESRERWILPALDSAPNGKRCEPFPRFEKGGEDSSTDHIVFPRIALLFTHWAFSGEIQRRSPTSLSKEERNEPEKIQLVNL